jgi:uncharacterized protein (TIGR02118 family)
MPVAKLVVIYPRPLDISAFEDAYLTEHVPIARKNLKGSTKAVLTKISASADGAIPPFHRIAEIHFPSLEALQACAMTEGAKKTLAHAVSISSGGPPAFLIAEEEVISMEGRAAA